MNPWSDEKIAANGLPVRENFLSWFADSKIVGEHGRPLQLYHGTNFDFDEFLKSKVGNNLGVDKQGFFFTNCADTAGYFAAPDDRGYSEEDRWDGALIIPVFLSISRPLTMQDVLDDFKMTAGDVFEEFDHVGEFFDWNRPNIFELADRQGCNGIFLNLEGFIQAVAFEPQQIKSAVGNAGLFLRDSSSLTDLDAAMALQRGLVANGFLDGLARPGIRP